MYSPANTRAWHYRSGTHDLEKTANSFQTGEKTTSRTEVSEQNPLETLVVQRVADCVQRSMWKRSQLET